MSVPPMGKLGTLLLLGCFGTAAVLMFESSGYRGLLALLGAMLVLLAMPASQWLPSASQRVMVVIAGALMALVISALCWALSLSVPKIAYGEYLLALALAVLLRWRDKPGAARPLFGCLVSASWFWLLAQVVIVADNWGGPRASDMALPCVAVLALLWPLMLLVPGLWPFKDQGIPGWRNRGLLFGGLLLLSGVVAVMGGGAYMRQRMAESEGDLQNRIIHWKEGVWMLKSNADFAFGKGAGRYVANRFFQGPKTDHTGDYRIHQDATDPAYLVLTGGLHMLGWGELFRVAQRISPPEGQVMLTVRARTAQDANLHTEICEKHLLYADHCLQKDVVVKAPQSGGDGRPWQEFKLQLGDGSGFGGPWYWPRLIAFSVAVDTPGGVIEIADLDLRDARGTPLLANGDFEQQMSPLVLHQRQEPPALAHEEPGPARDVRPGPGGPRPVRRDAAAGAVAHLPGTRAGPPAGAGTGGQHRRLPRRGRLRQPARRAAHRLHVLRGAGLCAGPAGLAGGRRREPRMTPAG